MRWPDFEAAFDSLRRDLAPDEWLLPVNLAEEKERFFATLAAGWVRNPVFAYAPVSARAAGLPALRDGLPSEPGAVADWYAVHIERLAEQVGRYARREAPDFPAWLTARYGRPEAELLEAAAGILRESPAEEPEPETLKAEDVRREMRACLEELKLPDWTVDIAPIAAKMEVQSLFRRIRIQEGARFSPQETTRLKAHEIGVHCLRYVNGARQPYSLFRHGLPDYLESEEGLAVYAEEKTGTLSGRDRRRYALRVAACDLAVRFGFHAVFAALREYGCSPEQAFSLAVRVKRGLADTALPGGWTKDQIYLRGWLRVRRACPEELRTLFLGKIGLQHIARCRALGLDADGPVPEWVEGAAISK
jgi:uncharacterized protein (TIGR02421 family)